MSTVGGGEEVQLPLSLEIVGADRSPDNNEGVMRELGGDRLLKNARSSELGDENASCSEHRGSRLLRVHGYVDGSRVRA